MEERKPGTMTKMMSLVDSWLGAAKKCTSSDLQRQLERCNQRNQKLVDSHVALIEGLSDWCEDLPKGHGRHSVRKLTAVLESVGAAMESLETQYSMLITYLGAAKFREERQQDAFKLNSQLKQKFKAASTRYGDGLYKTALIGDQIEENRYSLMLIDRQLRLAIENEFSLGTSQYFQWLQRCIDEIQRKLSSPPDEYGFPDDDADVKRIDLDDLQPLKKSVSYGHLTWNPQACLIPNSTLESEEIQPQTRPATQQVPREKEPRPHSQSIRGLVAKFLNSGREKLNHLSDRNQNDEKNEDQDQDEESPIDDNQTDPIDVAPLTPEIPEKKLPSEPPVYVSPAQQLMVPKESPLLRKPGLTFLEPPENLDFKPSPKKADVFSPEQLHDSPATANSISPIELDGKASAWRKNVAIDELPAAPDVLTGIKRPVSVEAPPQRPVW